VFLKLTTLLKTMPVKRLIDARRRRKNPPRGFGWIDHRLLRDGYLCRCSPESLALYVLLVCASDAQGLSYYSESRMAEILSLESAILGSCRQELIGLGLIAYQKPLYQLLSLEEGCQERAKGEEAEEPNERKLQTGTVETTREFSLKAMVERLLEQQRSGERLKRHDQL
jgi:hypothetical protein